MHREVRWPYEYATLMRDPVWRGEGVPYGDGGHVLLVCGFLAGDPSLTTMASWLKRIGHRPSRAGLRWNVGCTGDTVARLERRAEALAGEAGRRIAVVGQSRGGTCAKALAVRRPDLVERVVTLGSPLRDPLDVHPGVWASVHAVGLLGTLGVPGLLSKACRSGACCADVFRELVAPIPADVAFTSIYSRSDGIVRWRACREAGAEHVEVVASHVGMAVSAPVYRALGRALAP
jgi:pimeloyl-ACP methyl ester carboxylesterase